VELPQETKRRLGLDAERSWIVVSEGFAPDIARLQQLAAAEPESVAAALKRLEASHSVVCHPYHAAPWVIHPFSLSPTATWVQADQRGWWAPCIWCALGVAALVGQDVVVHCRIGAETEDRPKSSLGRWPACTAGDDRQRSYGARK
jgi:hypothetical protein